MSIFYIKLNVSLVVLFYLCNIQLQGQCKDKSVFEKAWISCETRPNPNGSRGEGHWIRYDLGYNYQLTSLQIWNNNKSETLDMGVRKLIMDVSEDGINWMTVDSFEVSKGTGVSYYSGEVVGQLNELQTRYVLLTLKENWGHPSCTSLDEVSFRIKQSSLPQTEVLWVYPNPAIDHATVSFEMSEGELVEVRVLDLLGKAVLIHEHEAISGRQAIRLNTERVRPGVYVVHVITGEGDIIGSKKLVIGK
ncbi:MAG: T9SS type A sorting domain-containing protein [Bacteroidia bacterium]|nr:T9SS type A sorting domain-containing protein [Bacteroidia bacterium]